MPPACVQIRDATADDAPFLRAGIWQAILASPTFVARLGLDALTRHEDDYWRGWPACGDPAFIALDEQGHALGALRLRPDDEASPPLRWRLGMEVTEEARRRGVGARLIDHAVRWCAARRARELTLLVDPTNLPALALYRRAGFVESGERVGVVGMRRAIGSSESRDA